MIFLNNETPFHVENDPFILKGFFITSISSATNIFFLSDYAAISFHFCKIVC